MAPQTDLGEALELLARVERSSRVLRGVVGERRRFRVAATVAVAEGVTDVGGLPIDLAGVPATPPEDLPRAGADMVIVGRPDRILRLRAFYLQAGMTVAVRGRMSLLAGRRLHRGAEILARVQRHTSLVVPQVLETGRRLNHSWVVEQLMIGKQVGPDAWPQVVDDVIDGLLGIWTARPLRHQSAARLVDAREMSHGINVLRAMPADAASAIPSQWLVRLAKLGEQMLVGWCHGDPSPANVLRLEDGRLALIDWEAADMRPLAHDAVKVLRWFDDPRKLADGLGERLTDHGSSVESWRRQVAIETIRALARSRRQHARAIGNERADLQQVIEGRRVNLVRLLSSLAD